MAPPSRFVLADDEEHNLAVVGWISHRLRRARLGTAPELPLPPGMGEQDRKRAYWEWGEIEANWGKAPNSSKLVEEINWWIEEFLQSGNHAAGKERQKMLMTLRSVRAGKKRRAEGAVRFEVDTELISSINEAGAELNSWLDANHFRNRPNVEMLLIRKALKTVFSDRALTKEIVDQVGEELSARKR